MNYKGSIIEESLSKADVLKNMVIVKTRKEKATAEYKTPWLTQWTHHTIEIPESKIDITAALLSRSFDMNHPSWYIDFKNDKYHFIIFPKKIFKVNLKSPILYKNARKYGESLGIPSSQMQFERLKR